MRAITASGSSRSWRSDTRMTRYPAATSIWSRLPREPVAVRTPPVELDDQLLHRPQHIDRNALSAHVGERARQLGLVDQLQQESFPLGTRQARVADQRADHARTLALRLAREDGGQGARRDDAPIQRLLEGAHDVVARLGGGQVTDRARDRGDRHPVHRGHVDERQSPGTVDPDPRMNAGVPADHRHVNIAADVRQQAE